MRAAADVEIPAQPGKQVGLRTLERRLGCVPGHTRGGGSHQSPEPLAELGRGLSAHQKLARHRLPLRIRSTQKMQHLALHVVQQKARRQIGSRLGFDAVPLPRNNDQGLAGFRLRPPAAEGVTQSARQRHVHDAGANIATSPLGETLAEPVQLDRSAVESPQLVGQATTSEQLAGVSSVPPGEAGTQLVEVIRAKGVGRRRGRVK